MVQISVDAVQFVIFFYFFLFFIKKLIKYIILSRNVFFLGFWLELGDLTFRHGT
jgi:hypothetical protein